MLLLLGARVPGGAGAAPLLRDITAASGITFVHGFGDSEMTNIVEATGPGVTLLDYDGDGDLDIYFVNGAWLKGINHPMGRSNRGRLKNALYRNDGKNRFTDVTGTAGVGHGGYGMASLAGDYDNDGDPDLFVANYGSNVFYRNNGDGTFTDITQGAGVGGGEWSVGCTFLDYDNDGFLDLFVGNYLTFDPGYRYYYKGNGFPGPLSYKGAADILYRNRGDGTFEAVTKKAGLHNPEGRAMGVTAADMDDDGNVDLFVANDAMENYFYRNNGDGTFSETAMLNGTAFGQNGEATSAMGPAFGDFDLDGRMDLLVPDMAYGCLYRNTGDGLFEEMSARVGLAAACGQYTSWSGNLFDLDNDGDLDILLVNGDSRFLEPEEDLLLAGEPGKGFVDISSGAGADFQKKHMGRGSAVGDLDNDGDADIVIANMNDRPRLLLNEGAGGNHWLVIRAVGTVSNRDAVGTRIKVTAGGVTMTRDIVSASGYLSQGDPRALFGLGKHEVAEKVRIRWPGGRVQLLENVAADRIVTVVEPAGK